MATQRDLDRNLDQQIASTGAGLTSAMQRSDVRAFVGTLPTAELRAARHWERYLAGGAFRAAVDHELIVRNTDPRGWACRECGCIAGATRDQHCPECLGVA